jgi:hypothetical protein
LSFCEVYLYSQLATPEWIRISYEKEQNPKTEKTSLPDPQRLATAQIRILLFLQWLAKHPTKNWFFKIVFAY